MRTKLILGPPGTGKTTRLLQIMEEELVAGVEPNRIAFCSFTRKAANEACSRACDKFGYIPKDLPYFRTLHSLAFMLLGLKQNEVLQTKHLKEIGRNLQLVFSGNSNPEEGIPTGRNAGDQYLFLDGYRRARCISATEAYRNLQFYDEMNWDEFTNFQQVLTEYKQSNNLMDFSDMIELCDSKIDVDVVILDEAQDLSTSQWKFANRVFSGAKRIYIAGDDDQAIYQWSGADVSEFLQIEGEKEILSQSWRVPKKVHTLAMDIASRISSRYVKEYNSKSSLGEVTYYPELHNVDISTGEWLLLCRNNFQIQSLIAYAREEGFNYNVRGEPGINPMHVKAIRLWERHRKGAYLTEDEWDIIKPFLPARCKELPTTIWHEAFHRMPFSDREWYVRLLKSGESLTKQPRINISTIHGIKGGEADNVLLLTDMSNKIIQTMNHDPDAEHRVWYVGVTRAKKNLHIIEPKDQNGYQL